ncbi:SLAP domain-containing protein [Companilactobacillus sp. HBUAS59544]|jgi:hypothetical protein|uniref:SLAP domain-containing protein n=1 Tax=Companilactobacillus sp. HBUAS59544 TaxID=3109363 RepID=UPI002FF11594
MKKFVKYLGVTAAMLLTVAPFAAPIETTTVQAYSEPDGTLDKPDATYTDNGDGTYTLHGTINAEIWTSEDSLESGNAIPISVEGLKANSKGIVRFAAPTIDGYKNNSDGYYELDLDNDGVYVYTTPTYIPTTTETINKNKTLGTPYAATVTLTRKLFAWDDKGNGINVPGTDEYTYIPAGSSWKVDRKMYRMGETYYRIGTNIWIDSRYGVQEKDSKNVVTTKWNSALFTKDGQKINNRALAGNTSWLTDQTATINGKTMYRVATNEWLSSFDVK